MVIYTKCEVCGKVTEPSKKNIKKEILFKKGQIISIKENDNFECLEIKFLRKDIYHYKNESWKMKAIRNLTALYMICPACNKKNYVHKPPEPRYFINHFSYNKDDWKIEDYNKTEHTKDN